MADDELSGGDVEFVNIPPSVDDDLSDQDEGDEDATGLAVVQDVPGSVEVHFSSEDEDETPAAPPKKKRKFQAAAAVWKRMDPQYSAWRETSNAAAESRQALADQLGSKTAVEIFELLFNDTVIQHILSETLRYAHDVKNDPQFNLHESELKAFLGVLLYSGYCKLPSERMYWSEAPDSQHPIIRNAMSRGRYMKIKSYLHVQDNSKLPAGQSQLQDRGFKVRPLLDLLNASFQQFGVFQEDLAVDEMMVRYYGHHSLKQFMRGKPIRFGYKLWALCSSDGYCQKFDLYCGKEQRPELQDLPLGTRVVLDMISAVTDPAAHRLFFDNLFTSRALLAELKGRGLRATGTVRENRLDKCPVTPLKAMTKTQRGTHEQHFDTTAEVLLVRWKDNKVVNIMTNFDTVEPVATTRWYDRAEKSRVDVPQPKVLKVYNGGMGGVDLHDWLLGQYEVSIRGKKWYWCLITRVLDMAMVNSWLLHRAAVPRQQQLTLLQFRRDIATAYLMASAAASSGAGAKSSGARRTHVMWIPTSLRYDGVGHLPGTLGFRRRCQLENCKKRSTKKCVKCDVPLCFGCFAAYHQST